MSNTNKVYYIDKHGSDMVILSPWAILEPSPKGPIWFEVYKTEEQAINAAKCYGLTIIDKPR